MSIPHFSNIIFRQAEKYQDRNVFFTRNDENKTWNPITWKYFADQVTKATRSLITLNTKRGDRIGIYTQNMAESFYVDFANFGIGAISVPMFATSSVSQIAYIINDAGIETLFVGEQTQYDNALKAADNCPGLERIIVFDPNVNLHNNGLAFYYKDFIDLGSARHDKEIAERQAQASPDDIAIIMYTSGTTGEPKGVILNHSNFLEAMRIHDLALPTFSENDRSIAFLPLSHIFERAWCYYCLYRGAVIYINLRPQEIQTAIREVRPTVMCSVPRFWEKVYIGVKEQINSFKPYMKGIVTWALALGEIYNLNYLRQEKKPPLFLKLKYKLVDKLIFSKVKKTVGIENANFFPTAGAALEDGINIFLRSMGIPIIIGYGLTESTATVCCFRPTRYVIGSAGKIMDGLEARIGEDNEIQLKGKTITQGYYKKPEATEAAFIDGWFRTGDAGKIDSEGNITLVERIKDLFKTSNGKYIAPQQIEMKLGTSKYVDQAAVIGDQRNYVTAIIVPALPEVEKLAAERNIRYNLIDELLTHPDIIAFYQSLIDSLQQEMASYEKVKKFTLIKKGFTIESGEMTSTLKLRRAVIMQNYRKLIDEMYK
ncbi:AMP-dependent synthetase/ligase [Paludibacter jiangxiensis]|uniref:Long-chain acyl-CoA synthetase n=1 Tax=Paludibacter jiangxiensis TaxID=681398 RepID=A0A170Y1P1_9BACT|nr:long-chain fatty acid--CoA ligase [Paludibacter jiangxiensis]GAT61431.1 long-chain acyl-CoA synthetase [Paludibacter jiangxiensis]